ncbi:PREDICTED: uncharacterized protein LOC108578302, partial [Habropoda laboriosa]|uniref:uncharacterized protein LOC108578302 n=1 Tax=Habropoda laboriosa TaxID=597456 RepID=UPI00083DEC4C
SHRHLAIIWRIDGYDRLVPIDDRQNDGHSRLVREKVKNNINRTEEGRYVVALPFKDTPFQLGDSKYTALRRFYALEKKFASNPEFKKQYTAVSQKYIDLGHLSIATDNLPGFYLPHHGILKEGRITKLRVVFDGFAKSSTGISLNETLMIGPTVQDDLLALILRFRMHNNVLTGDIEKMYRQFSVKEEDRKYQRILWRATDGKITTYQLNRVIFGLSAAPCLATRCINQLATDEAHAFPTASTVLKRDLYLDDLITDTQTRKEAIQLRDEIIQLLQRDGIHIRQWASNDQSLLEGLPEGTINLELQEDHTIKTLGEAWNSQNDTLE